MSGIARNAGPAAGPAGGDLTVGPIGPLLRRLAIPASIGFFFNTLFNVVDTYFAGLLSTQALAALALSFPVFFSIIAMGTGFATGTTALVGHALGRDDRREAALLAAQGYVLALFLGLVLLGVGYGLAPSLFRLLGARNSYLEFCLDYMNVILVGTSFIMLVHMGNAVLNALGDMRTFRNFLIAAALLNVGLDPWFMFGGLGLPPLGIRGVALATILLQGLGAIYIGRKVWRTGLLHRATGARWRPQPAVLRAIAAQGVPASLNMMTVALGIFVITYFLGRFGQAAVAAYGVATRIEQIALLPTIGLNVATLALTAQNGGAGRLDRVEAAVRSALAHGAVAMAFASAALYLGARPLMGLFADDAGVIEIGARYLRIAAFIEYAYVILFVNTSALQGLKRPAFALWIGLSRQLVAPIALFTLTTVVLELGLVAIWWSIFGIAWTAAAVAVIYARRTVSDWKPDGGAHR
jgi:putative MATE family efflux protein